MATSDFSWANAVDTATLKAGSEAATLPSSNLASARFGAVWRSLATTSYFVATFAAPVEVDVLALAASQYFDSNQKKWFASLQPTDSIRHRLYDAGNNVLLDVTVAAGVLDGYRMHVYLTAGIAGVVSWRCDIVATSQAAAGFFDIARAWAGPVWRPAIGIALPWDETWNDGAAIVRGKISGALFDGDGPQYRSANLVLDFMPIADKTMAKELARLVGIRYQVLVIPDEAGDIPREAILGHFDKMQPITASQPTIPATYQQSFSLFQDL